MSKHRVEDNLDYKKDTATGSVVNDNASAYHNARMRAGKTQIQEQRMKKIETDLETLTNLLRKLTDG